MEVFFVFFLKKVTILPGPGKINSVLRPSTRAFGIKIIYHLAIAPLGFHRFGHHVAWNYPSGGSGRII